MDEQKFVDPVQAKKNNRRDTDVSEMLRHCCFQFFHVVN
jgi:hypothetical protein